MSDKLSTKAFMSRIEANREILLLLEEFLEANPDIRFAQALSALGINSAEDNFYQESLVTLSNLQQNKSLQEKKQELRAQASPLESFASNYTTARSFATKDLVNFIQTYQSPLRAEKGIAAYAHTRDRDKIAFELKLLLGALQQ